MESVKFKILKRNKIIALNIDPSQSVMCIKEVIAGLLVWDHQGINLILNGNVLDDEVVFTTLLPRIKKYVYVYYEFQANLESAKKNFNEAKTLLDFYKTELEKSDALINLLKENIDLKQKLISIHQKILKSIEQANEERANFQEIQKILNKDIEEMKFLIRSTSQFE